MPCIPQSPRKSNGYRWREENSRLMEVGLLWVSGLLSLPQSRYGGLLAASKNSLLPLHCQLRVLRPQNPSLRVYKNS
ncbi:hypothetical protein BDW74DRAFT_157197 [Aspergillus multicolor]|uniref:uncharacterized protein n=1 Tax=Aspergillus multicolor TaxID=41759 RepID=UPI003CCCA63F